MEIEAEKGNEKHGPTGAEHIVDGILWCMEVPA